jgi:hypothetical protein
MGRNVPRIPRFRFHRFQINFLPMQKEPSGESSFFPSGAIVFFILLIALYNVIWFGMHWILITRS